MAFKTGFNNLASLDISYSSLTGQCFNNLNCSSMKKINVNCSSRLKTKGALILLTKCGNTLQHLDLSVTKIDDDFITTLQKYDSNTVKTLYLDFCESISLPRVQESLPEAFPSLKILSIFGIASTCENGKFHSNLQNGIQIVKIVVTSMGSYTFLLFLYRCYCEGIEKKSSEIENCDMS